MTIEGSDFRIQISSEGLECRAVDLGLSLEGSTCRSTFVGNVAVAVLDITLKPKKRVLATFSSNLVVFSSNLVNFNFQKDIFMTKP